MTTSKDMFIDMREQEQAEAKTKRTAEIHDTEAPAELMLNFTPKRFKDLNIDAITDLARAVTDEYLDGYKSPSDGLIWLKKVDEFTTLVKENIKDAAANELKLTKGEKRVINGCSINEQMTGVRYDYSTTNDPVWTELNAKIKEREKFLQGIKGKLDIVVNDAEVVTITEPVKSGKMSLIIKVL